MKPRYIILDLNEEALVAQAIAYAILTEQVPFYEIKTKEDLEIINNILDKKKEANDGTKKQRRDPG